MNSRIWKIFIVGAVLATLTHCNTTDRTRRAYLRANALTLGEPARPVIVIAGFGVTRLIDPATNRHVWGTPSSVWHREFPDDLDLDADDRLVPRGWAGSRGPINTGWQISIALQKYGGYRPEIAAGDRATIHPFHYDWRRSAIENGELLGELIQRVGNGGRVDVVTHSAGGLVALAYIATAREVAVENLVLIAPPQRGVVEAFRIFVRPERFLRRTFTPDIVATWPSVFELLPEDGRVFIDESGKKLERDLWDPATWSLDVAMQLAAARAVRERLRTASVPDHVTVTVIAGDCVPTARRILQRRDGTYAFYERDLRPEEKHLATVMFEPGDGTVPVSSAAAISEPILLCDGHQGIAADPTLHRTLIRILRGGVRPAEPLT